MRLDLVEDGADPERLATLTSYLRDELRQLDVADVTYVRSPVVPVGARVVEPAAVGALLVTLGRSAQGLQSVVRTLRQWLGRGDAPVRTVRLEIGGDVLQLSNASAAEQDRLIELFVHRHDPQAHDPEADAGR